MVLVIDDNEIDLQILKGIIESSKFGAKEIKTFPSAFLALEEVIQNKNNIELIVSDYEMPGMNGFGLLCMVKDIEPNIPFVMVSGCTDPKRFLDIIFSKGLDWFIEKPFNIEKAVGFFNKIYK